MGGAPTRSGDAGGMVNGVELNHEERAMPVVRVLKILTGFQWRLQAPNAKDGRVIAVCDKLGLTVEAEKPEELRETIDSATNLLFRDLMQEGELHRFCQERDIKYQIENVPSDVMELEPPSLLLSEGGNATI